MPSDPYTSVFGFKGEDKVFLNSQTHLAVGWGISWPMLLTEAFFSQSFCLEAPWSGAAVAITKGEKSVSTIIVQGLYRR